MKIDRLRLKNFRNYTELEIDLHSSVNVIVGDNAQGKTNILEALSFCLAGESFRPGKTTEFINFNSNSESSFINAEVVQKDVNNCVDINISVDKSVCFLNNKKLSREELRRRFSVVVFSPDTLSVIKQGPIERRNLIDDIFCSIQREKPILLGLYQKCLKTRNKVLKDRIEGSLNENAFQALLEGINTQFLEYATDLTVARINTLKSILPNVKERLNDILNKPSTQLTVEYLISNKSAIDWSPNQVYDSMHSRLKDLSGAERRVGQSLVGPHKHDVKFILNGQDARFYASQGQQRSIALAFKIAQVEQHFKVNGDYPVLLLDDVFSELDTEKQNSLLKILVDMSAQIFLTTTDFEKGNVFYDKEKSVFTIKKGIVQRDGISVRKSDSNNSSK